MKAKDKEMDSLIGTIYSIGSPDVAEIISLAGFDWILIDMEHSTLSLETVQYALGAAGEKIKKIVRVPGNDEIWIKRVLDTGCDGILVPMVKNAEEAERAILSAKYPVEGQRSVGVTRAHKYGTGFTGYVERANKEIIIMIQVEHIEAVNNIDSILAVKGIGSVFIGPYDLSASMGLMGQTSHPEVRAAIEIVTGKCRKAGIPWGIFGASAEALSDYKKQDCRYLLCGIDSVVLMNSYKEIVNLLRKD